MIKPAYPQVNGYSQSSVWFDLIDTDRPNVISGHAQRSGVTAPGLPDRACYYVTVNGKHDGTVYVLEDNALMPYGEWRAGLMAAGDGEQTGGREMT